MSLMNQVLRDLQLRQVAPVEAGLQAHIAPVIPASRSLISGWVLLVSILLISAAAGSLLLDLNENSQPAAEITRVALEREIFHPATTTALPGVHLTAVRLKSTVTFSQLLLEFSQVPSLVPEILLDGRRLRVLLPELETTAQRLPQPNLNDSLVKQLRLHQVDHLWQLQVDFNTDVRVETVASKAAFGHGPKLILAFYPITSVVLPVEKEGPADIPALARPEVRPAISPQPAMTKQERIPTAQESAEHLYLQGVAAAKNNFGGKAVGLWSQALKLHPMHLMARKRTILALLPTDRGEADALFSSGAALHNSLDFRKWYAGALLSIADPGQALKILAEQEVLVEVDAEYVALQAALWQQTGDYAQSQQAYRDLLKEYPAKEIYLFGLAVALDQQAQGDEALTYYRRALNGLDETLWRYASQRIEALAAPGVGQ